MTLGDFELLPGVVISNSDPLNQGRVKAVAPGLFDSTTMNEEDLFWINPFMMIGHQSFSKLEVSSKIWILHNKNNYFEYWYIPMFELNRHVPEGAVETDCDILLSRNISGELVQLYYSRDEGFRINIGNNGVSLLPDGSFKLKAGKSVIEAKDSGIKIGKDGGSYNSATLAEPLITILSEHCNWLLATAAAACYTPFTIPMATTLTTAALSLQSKLDTVQSEFVKISK